MSNRTQKEAAAATASGRRLVLLGILAIVLLIATMWIANKKPASAGCADANITPRQYDVKLASSSDRLFRMEVASKETQRDQGLSMRECFPSDGALLFVFPTDDKFGIWMKDMRFPIDVVWLNKDKKIVSIHTGMQPDSYPKIYYPDADARYVLEFAQGTASALGLQVGHTMQW